MVQLHLQALHLINGNGGYDVNGNGDYTAGVSDSCTPHHALTDSHSPPAVSPVLERSRVPAVHRQTHLNRQHSSSAHDHACTQPTCLCPFRSVAAPELYAHAFPSFWHSRGGSGEIHGAARLQNVRRLLFIGRPYHRRRWLHRRRPDPCPRRARARVPPRWVGVGRWPPFLLTR